LARPAGLADDRETGGEARATTAVEAVTNLSDSKKLAKQKAAFNRI
jgi:hypothetical protein